MQFVLLCFSILGYLYFLHAYFKCKLIQTPFYFSTVIILILYLFAINNLLSMGAYICLSIGILLGCGTLYLNRKKLVKPTVNIYELLYILPLITIMISIPSNYQFMDWDEFSFWGLSIKIIATADTLYNASYPTEYNHYPPGQQLFQYFIVKFTGWSEKNALYAQIIFCYSTLLYIAGSFFKQSNLKTLIIFLTACMFIYYFGGMYATVYADKLLAFYFCAALVCAYFAGNSLINGLLLCAVVAVLILIKQIGLIMALLVIAAYGVASFPTKTASNNNVVANYFQQYRTWVIVIFCLLVSVFFSYKSWTWYVNSIQASKEYYIPEWFEFFQGDRLQMLGAVLLEFFTRIQIPTFINIRDAGISLVSATFLLFLISIFIIATSERSKRVVLAITLGIIFIGWIGYILFHLYAYMVFFGRWEALSLSSFERYAAIYCLSWMLFCFFLLSFELLRFKSKIVTSILILFCIFTTISLYPKLRWDLKESFVTYNYDILQRVNRDRDLVSTYAIDTGSVYFIAQGASAYDRWAFYYSVYPKMKQFNPWSLCEARDGYTCSYKDFQDALAGSQYLMLSKADDYFWQQAGHLFDASEYGTEYGLYEIKYQNNKVVKLVRLDTTATSIQNPK